jgi:uncharacterized protein YhfF
VSSGIGYSLVIDELFRMLYPREVTDYWEHFRRQYNISDSVRWEAWAFGDNPKLADELLGLVLKEHKRATADLVTEFEIRGEKIPEVGGYSVILDGGGKPAAVIMTTKVNVAPFLDVPAEFAFEEGEDDRTLESWRREHRKYFTRFLGARGLKFDEKSLFVMESFELLHPKNRSDKSTKSNDI